MDGIEMNGAEFSWIASISVHTARPDLAGLA